MVLPWPRPPTPVRANFRVISYNEIYYIGYMIIYEFQQKLCVI